MIPWDDSILVGIPTVDSDHKDILEHINRFIAAIESDSKAGVIHDAFRRMEHRIYRHLAVEEEMLEALGYVDTAEHKKSHVKLLDQLDEIWDDMLADFAFHPDEAAREWLKSWLFQHVRSEDFQYRDWIVGAGLEDEAERKMNDQRTAS